MILEKRDVFDYSLTEDATSIVVSGIVMRSIVYDYPDKDFKKVYKPPEEIRKIPEVTKWVKVTLAHTDSVFPSVFDQGQVIGDFYPISGEGGKLFGKFIFSKKLLPLEVAEMLRAGKEIGVSTGFDALLGKSGSVDGMSYDATHTNIQLGHVAIITPRMQEMGVEARCNISEGCGVGITDATTVLNGSEHTLEMNELNNSVIHTKGVDSMSKVEETKDPAPAEATDTKEVVEDYKGELDKVLDALRSEIIEKKCQLINKEDLEQIKDAKSLMIIKKLLDTRTPKHSLNIPVGEAITQPVSFEDARKADVKARIKFEEDRWNEQGWKK